MTPGSTTQVHDPLAGGGEMGALMRSIDWSTTAVGPVSGWPQSLRTALSILLETGFPMYIAWGAEFTQFYNDGYRPILGSTKHPAAMGISTRQTFAEIWEIIGPMFQEVMAGKPTTVVDFLLPLDRHGFSEECYFVFSYSPIRDETGAVGGVLVTVTETTQRVLGARRLATLQALAAETREAQTVSDVCVVAARVLAANSHDLPFTRIYLVDRDRKRAELAGASGAGSDVNTHVAVDLSDARAPWPLGQVVRTQVPATVDAAAGVERTVVLPVMLQGTDKALGVLVAAVSPRLLLDDDYRSFLSVVASQIGTAIASAQALQEAKARAEALAELDRAKTAFFSNVSHEFRTPLTLLLGPVQDALASTNGTLEREQLTLVDRNAQRLLRLVNTLLDFSRIEAGRIDANFEPIDVAIFTAELASLFRSAVEKAGLELIVDCAPQPDIVYVDREMWEKIVLNLLSNAFKFTFDGRITVQLRSLGDRVELRVADTGVGIPPADLPRMFERFHRVAHRRARTYEGSGIGLALVHELVRIHGGSVTVASEQDRGTTFTVTVPTGTAHLPAERITASRQQPSASTAAIPYVDEAPLWLPANHDFAQGAPPSADGVVGPSNAAARILVADDNADMRDYLRRLLGQHYRVEVVGDGRAALDRIRHEPPDLVLADVMMPTLDGFGLVDGIRADERSRWMPIILLSARAGEEARIDGLRAGADEYLVKPFSGRELLACVASQLALSRVRRDTEGALRYRSEQFQTLLNQAPLGVYVVDADFRICAVNPVALPVFGEIPGGVIGRDFDEVLHILWDTAHADELVRIFRHTLASGEPYVTLDHAERRQDRGVTEFYEWRVDRITLPDGRFGVVCYFRDVSAQKQALAAKAYLAAIVDSADDAILSKDLDGVIQSANGSAERLFGYAVDELVGRPVRMLIPPDRQSEEDDILARIRQGLRVEHFETVRMAKDGRRLDVALTISPVRDDTGVIVGASKIVRDIAALKQSEAERIRLLQETATVTETLNNVGAIVASDLDRTNVVQAVTDAATQLTTAEFGAFFYNVLNEHGESYTLYTISGVPREAFSKFPMPRNTEVFEPTFKGTAVVRSPDITTDPRYGHNAPHHGMPKGHLPVRSYLAVPVKGRSGDVIGGLFFGHSAADRFTEQHERLAIGVASWASVALENARMYMSVQEASRIKDDFLASLSHELRTPLNAILGYARMLRTGIVAPDKRDKAVETIERNATSLTQIVEDVLDISRIVSGKMRLNVQPIELPEIVQSGVDAIAPAADAKGVRIETILDPDAGPVSGDPERLQQVIWNLLSNAVKFTNRGGRVQVRLERVNSHLEVSVSDTGIGIAAEFLPHVFERFRQADAGMARERGGLGLGLSIVRQLIELHGGTIDASSGGLSQGSTFRLKIPLMIVHPVAEDETRVHPRASTRAKQKQSVADLGGLSVLVIDDEPDALALVFEVLQAAGARVRTAASAAEGLQILDGDVPDVVVADIGMPQVDGFQFIDRVRRHSSSRVRDLPVAALTAYARSEDRMKVLQAGFQMHLAKPIDPAELVTTIAALAKRFGPRLSENEGES